jgi:YHS domain-containing protein
MTAVRTILLALPVALMAAAASLAQGGDAATPAVSLKGYDVVAYFAEGRPVKGSPEFRQDWDGIAYHFASEQHRAAFAANPDRYTPQFTALCATGVSMGKKVEADPNVWKIVDGKLYLFSSAKAREMAERDSSLLTRSHEIWPTLK